MRWPIIRLIWLRELRDQLRDRRTLFMIAGLPLLLYPVLGFAVLRFAAGFADRPSVVAVVGSADDFPARAPALLAAAFQIPPAGPAGAGVRPDYLAGAVTLVTHPALQYPPLTRDGRLFLSLPQRKTPYALAAVVQASKVEVRSVDAGRAAALLATKEVDLVLIAPPDFWAGLSSAAGPRAAIEVRSRRGDDASQLALQRVGMVLDQWKAACKAAQLERRGLPGDYDEPFEIRDPSAAETLSGAGADLTSSLMLRIFPFMLVMWSLAGALYPAVDVCAGEKERGTMETLLISPAGRAEIVLGKFLTIWVFSGATALLNLASMGMTTWIFGDRLPTGGVSAGALAWCVVLVLPLSAMFSAVCLAIGAYARSSKEGQYYLMPLFLITMPLIFLTLAPGVELNSFYSMVPVTGVAMLMQSLMTAPSLEEVPWLYFLPVLAPVVLYSWLALRWAIDLFQREEVLFREAERVDVRLWLRRLFREKEAMPTAGQALFCFGLLLGLRWLSLGLGSGAPLLVRRSILLSAFELAPPVFMALLLTRRPRQALSLRYPRLGYLFVAVLLLPVAELAHHLLARVPRALELMQDRQLFLADAFARGAGVPGLPWGGYVLLLAVLSAVSKEVAFRGLILNGLRERFRPTTAILVSSFLFAAFHMNVFLLLPAFLLGLALGALAVWSGSLLPGILLHLGCYAVMLQGPDSPGVLARLGWVPVEMQPAALVALAAACAAPMVYLLWRLKPTAGETPKGERAA